MKGYKLISSKQIVAELYADYNIQNDDFVDAIQRHIARALGIMQVQAAYVRKYKTVTVKNFTAPLPCDSKMVLGVVLPNCGFNRLTITNSWSIGKNFKDLNAHSIYKGGFNFNQLDTNFSGEDIMFIYHAYPTDGEGNLLIPDDALLLEVLPFFIIYKLGLKGYKHPVISIENAERKWELKYPQARNSINAMSLEEADRFVKMLANPLFTDILNEDWGIDTAETGLSSPEFIEQLNRIYSANQ